MLDDKLMQTALSEIQKLRDEMIEIDKSVDKNDVRYKSLLNLKQYLALRSKDQTKLQEKLFLLSLSSLGRSYAHVAGSIETLCEQISSSLNKESEVSSELEAYSHLSIKEAIELASKNATLLFGGKISSKISKQKTAIMVTLPSDATENDGKLIFALANAGVSAFRINTAHDDAETWQAMADYIAVINSSREDESRVKIFVDLAGPKIRTGKIRKLELPVVIGSNKLKKEILIFHAPQMHTTPEYTDSITLKTEPAHIVTDKKFFKKLKENGHFKIVDVNGKKVFAQILEKNDTFIRAEIYKKVYIDSSTKLHKKKLDGDVLNIELQVEPIRLFRGDLLDIAKDVRLGRNALYNDAGEMIDPALISCTLLGITEKLNVGEKIFIDDGKIGLEVINNETTYVRCRVLNAKINGTLLKEEKGINFPDTHVQTDALTPQDCENALSVMNFVDSFSLSFSQSAEDVKALQDLLTKNNRKDIGIVTKIETLRGVVNMPEILQELLKWEKSGVMIARGDLAIEVGFQNLAHIQEALLEICDAAHIPVIWATQVLEGQMKTNLPSRAEITDAAMSGRAECVMLNKGAFATNTIGILIHILDDIHMIFKKNRQLLSKESLWI